MKRALILFLLSALAAFGAGPPFTLMINRTNYGVAAPTNFWSSNLFAGAGISLGEEYVDGVVRLWITNTASGGGATNLIAWTNGIAVGTNTVINFIAGTNVILEATNNDPTSIDIMINAAGGGGGGSPDGVLTIYTNGVPLNPGLIITNLNLLSLSAALTITGTTNLADTFTNQISFELDSDLVDWAGISASGLSNFINSKQVGSAWLTNLSTNAIITNLAGAPPITNLTGITNVFQIGSQVLSNLAATGAITNLGASNTLFVMENGDDSTAVKGRLDLPWGTITNAAKSASSGDTILVYPGDYVYEITDNEPVVDLVKLTNFSLLGVGNPVIWVTNQVNAKCAIQVSNCVNTRIDGFTIQFPKVRDGVVAGDIKGIELAGNWPSNIVIEHMRFYNCPGNVITHEDGNHGRSENVAIRFNEFYECGSTNVVESASAVNGSIVAGIGNGWDISHNYSWNCARGIEVEHLTTGGRATKDTRIQNNIIIGTWEKTIFSQVQGDGTNVGRLIISGNIVDAWGTNGWNGSTISNLNFGISVLNVTDTLIENNIVNNVNDLGICVEGVYDRNARIVIRNNMVRDAKKSGIVVYGQTNSVAGPILNVDLSGNMVSKSRGHGIAVQANGAHIHGNYLLDNGYSTNGYGIYLWGNKTDALTGGNSTYQFPTNAVIENNFIYDNDATAGNTDIAIVVTNAYNVAIRNNYYGPGITPHLVSASSNVSYGANTNDWMSLTYDATPDNADFIPAITADGTTIYRTAIGDLPAGAGATTVQTNSIDVGSETRLNLIAGANMSLVVSNVTGTNTVWISSSADGTLLLENNDPLDLEAD